MKKEKEVDPFGEYPSCDLLNNALRFLRDGNIDVAIEEIVFAIDKAGGYYHEDIKQMVEEIRHGFRRRLHTLEDSK